MTIIGERSRPIWNVGSRRRIGRSTGSVTRYRKRTIGLYGSGLTHEMIARAMMIQMYAREHELERVREREQEKLPSDEHQAGPRPSSRER